MSTLLAHSKTIFCLAFAALVIAAVIAEIFHVRKQRKERDEKYSDWE
jgi:hypothetical protein